MARYLIDLNLPYYFSLWRSEEYLHVRDLGDAWTDSQVWDYAQQRELTIVTKDTDFSDRILLSVPPPRVIHIKLGNMRMRDFHQTLFRRWEAICELSRHNKLVQVFEDRIEAVDKSN